MEATLVIHPLPILHCKGSSVEGAPPTIPPPCSESGVQATHGRPPEPTTEGNRFSPLTENSVPNQAVDCAPSHGRTPDHSFGKELLPSIGADVPNRNVYCTYVHGRLPDHTTTPSLTHSPTTCVRSPATSGSLPRQPECGIWADVDDVYEAGSNTGIWDNALSGGSQRTLRVIAFCLGKNRVDSGCCFQHWLFAMEQSRHNTVPGNAVKRRLRRSKQRQ